MSTFSLYGQDSISVNERLLKDFGSGEVAKVSFPNELTTLKTGKNGNTIIVQNASGFQATLEIKVIRGSDDDKYLNSRLTLWRETPTLYVLDGFEVVKKIGDGAGAAAADTYLLKGGVPSKQVEVVSNVEGDVEQGISVYTWVFSANIRSIS